MEKNDMRYAAALFVLFILFILFVFITPSIRTHYRLTRIIDEFHRDNKINVELLRKTREIASEMHNDNRRILQNIEGWNEYFSKQIDLLESINENVEQVPCNKK